MNAASHHATARADQVDPADLIVPLEQLRERRSAKWRAYPPDVLPAWVAEMDFTLAPPITEALQSAVERGDAGYAWPSELPQAFADFARDRFDWPLDPESVAVVPDVMAGVAEVIRLLTDPGDAVVINPPVYPPFFAVIPDNERKIVEAPLARAGGGWELDLDALEDCFAGGARAYLLCHPHNPTGRGYDRATLTRIGELAARYDVAVISDEIHAPLTLPGASHSPYAPLAADGDAHAVTITSASKAWNVPGLKCALVVPGPARTRERLRNLPEELPYHAGHLGVIAAVAAFRDGGPWLDAVRTVLAANRALLADLLAEHLSEVRYAPPQASYLAWLDCTALGLGPDPAATFLKRGRVALSQGPTFGRPGDGFARLNIGTSPELVEEAVRRMAAAVAT